MSLVKVALALLGILAAVALAAGGVAVLTRGGNPPTSARAVTSVGESVSAQPEETPVGVTARNIPPIDAEAPDTVETATFALG
jgi:hypothetical protein